MKNCCGVHALRIAVEITILALLLASSVNATTITVNASVGGDYKRIQDAIDNARAGDTIIVYTGTYFENVKVNKKLTLRGIGNPVVDAGGSGNAITLTANGIILEGFTATGSGGYWDSPEAGIKVSSSNNTLKGNTANSNRYGGGISLSYSRNNALIGNNASNNGGYIGGFGISLSNSSNNTLICNNVSNNDDIGIYLSSSSNNTLTGNMMTGNQRNFNLDGDIDSDFDNFIDTGNLVDGRSIYYIIKASDTSFDSSSNAGTFYCISCVNVTIKNLIFNKNGKGIFFWNTSQSRIQNVNASNNYNGIYLSSSSNNTLTGIKAYSNYGDGIHLSSSNKNTLAGNNASDNRKGSYTTGSGISLSNSSNNTLTDNNASNNDNGISLSNSGNNTLSRNNANSNIYYFTYIRGSIKGGSGISFSFSSNNTLTDNNISNNGETSISLDEKSDSAFNNQIDTTNLVDGKPIYFIKGATDIVYNSSSNAGTFYCISCVNVTLKNLDLKNNGNGIFFWNTTNSKIQNVNASSNNGNGIYLSSSSNNALIGNNASNNDDSGIYLKFSSNNTLIGNNASNNLRGIYLSSSSNNTLSGNNASNNNDYNSNNAGISLYDSSNNNTLSSNTANSNVFFGIFLDSSSNNTVTGNNASNNLYGGGISLGFYTNNNTIYNNVFSQNNFYSYDSNNTWNTTRQSGTNIIGGSYLGGNVWVNYDGTGFSQTCKDANGDGICDQSYTLNENNIDYLPLSMNFAKDRLLPKISFTDPTPENAAILAQNYTIINTTISNALTAFIDWNGSLVGWWRFNNENGENKISFRDWSNRKNNAKCSGTNCPDAASGKFGKALRFDGVNDYLDAGKKTNLNIKSAITIEAWINPSIAQEKCWDGVSGNYGVLSKVEGPENSANWSWQLRYGAPDSCYLGFQFNGNPEGNKWVTVKQNLTAGQWYHIAGTFNGKEIKSYLNGKLKDTNKISSIKGYHNKLLIGNDGWANYFSGKIDDVRIHRRALSTEEIKASHDAGRYGLYRNFTNMAKGNYNYRAFVQNVKGSVNQTEKRTLGIFLQT